MNNSIKERAKKKGVLMWQIAQELGIADATLSRKLRNELSADEQQQIVNIIDRIAKERVEED